MSLNNLLKIDQFNALNLEVTGEGEVLIHGELKDTDKTCPACGKEAEKPHQYYEKRARHLPMMSKPTYLVFERKDWICSCGKVFLERLSFQELRSTYTRQYGDYIFRQCKHMATSTVAEQEQLEWHVVAGIFKKGSLRERKSRYHRRSGRLNTASSG